MSTWIEVIETSSVNLVAGLRDENGNFYQFTGPSLGTYAAYDSANPSYSFSRMSFIGPRYYLSPAPAGFTSSTTDGQTINIEIYMTNGTITDEEYRSGPVYTEFTKWNNLVADLQSLPTYESAVVNRNVGTTLLNQLAQILNNSVIDQETKFAVTNAILQPVGDFVVFIDYDYVYTDFENLIGCVIVDFINGGQWIITDYDSLALGGTLTTRQLYGTSRTLLESVASNDLYSILRQDTAAVAEMITEIIAAIDSSDANINIESALGILGGTKDSNATAVTETMTRRGDTTLVKVTEKVGNQRILTTTINN